LNVRCLTHRHVACIGEISNANKTLVGKSEEERQLGRLKHRWEGNIKMELKQIV
jgi:hypothetical protein